MTATVVLILLLIVTCVLMALIVPLYLKIGRLEALLQNPSGGPTPAPTIPEPTHEADSTTQAKPEFETLPPIVAPPSSFSRNPVEMSAEEKARLELQRSVEQARLTLQQTGKIPTPQTESGTESTAPESTVQRTQATAEGEHYLVPCPECAFEIPISATDKGSRYVCPQCSQPIRFDD